ncbi:MAG: ubiquinol-cytochrome c reductase iron-sulfur subunit [Gammaproteobacteria bacterium]|nr:MAG: ubiquinol-cytochrome c reductase iron-sulfur subunit [Gammaproteobacteria bacterium]
MDSVIDLQRRRFLTASVAVVGAAGAAGAALPFIASWQPSERTIAAGAPVVVDFSKLEPGQQLTVEWRRQPIWVLRRTPEMLATLPTLDGRLRDPNSDVETQQPIYARNAVRSIREEYLVVIAICTHLGCVPSFRPDIAPADLGPSWPGGYFCPCHGSRFDFAGRVFRGVPAPTNLVIPPYKFVSDTVVAIGIDNA